MNLASDTNRLPASVTPADLSATVTYGHEVTARGFFGRLRQRGLAITGLSQTSRPTIALTAYTANGPSTAARLEVPVSDLRSLARVLLDLADRADGTALRRASCSIGELALQRRAG
jgi:hypothetical protein